MKKSYSIALITLGELRKLYKTWQDLKSGSFQLIQSDLPDDTVLLETDYEIREMSFNEEQVLTKLLDPCYY